MDFLDTVTDGIENAVGAVLAPVAETAEAAAGALRRELTQTWHGVFGSPTPPGGTNWNAYSHQELFAMVTADADAGQVGEQSAVLDGLGRGAFDCADELSSQRRQVAEVWQGTASGAFDSTLDEHSTGGTAVAEHAAALSAAVARASEALSRAQSTMPTPVDVGAATSYGAVAGGTMAGPAFALGSVSGAGASWFGASLLAANKKAEAVEVMQAFEQSLVAADPPDAPAKLPPGVPGGHVPLPAPRPESSAVAPVPAAAIPAVGSAPAAPAPSVRAAAAGPVTSAVPIPEPGPATTASGAVAAGPGSSAVPTPPVQAAAAGPGTSAVPIPEPGPATTASSAVAANPGQAPGLPAQPAPRSPNASSPAVGARSGRPLANPGRGGGWASGPDGRPTGPPVAWRDLVGRGATAGLLTDAERPARPTAAGAVPAAATRREEDREHHNRMPRADKLFTLDDRTPPPVIGA